MYDRLLTTCMATCLNLDMEAHLTPREQTLIPLLIQGMTDKEIARELGLLDSSVRTYVGVLRKKFGVTNRTRLALKLIQVKGE